jgi:hypothetical protein
MKRLVALAVLLAVGLAYLAGFWPQHQRVLALETEAGTLRDRVADLEARTRAAALLGELLNVTDAASRKDYGQAQQLSSAFFDHVRAEAAAPGLPAMKPGLPSILAARDAVTSALARGDEQVVSTLRELELKLRVMLGYTIAPQ